MLDRRQFLAAAAAAFVTPPRLLLADAPPRFGSLPVAFASLEKRSGGRLGVAVFDSGSGGRTGYRTGERFPMCSTFKLLLVAATLHRSETGQDKLARAIPVPSKPLLGHSPLTEPHAGGRMSIASLCSAALIESDNTAANLLLEALGGPAAYTRYARSLGDSVTRLDRNEPALNTSLPDDPRDTTSPEAAVHDLQRLIAGNALQSKSRDQLITWMVGCRTGLDRLRAGIPASWRSGDRTGSNGEHTSNDIAVAWPVGRPPVFIAAYVTQSPGSEATRSSLLAEIGHLVAGVLS